MRGKVLLLAGLWPLWAQAHPQGHSISFFNGFSHPWLGADHLLAMLAVGMLAASIPSLRRGLALPALFLLGLLSGVWLGSLLQIISSVEYLVAASVALLGVTLLFSSRLLFSATCGIVLCSGVLHGLVHGLEMPAASALLPFLSGLMLASALLHGGGFVWLRYGSRRVHQKLAEVSAMGLTLAGLVLLWGV